MTDQPICVLCGQPVADMAYVCHRCGELLGVDLAQVALVAGEAETTVAKLARIASSGGRPQPEEPEPKNASALFPTPLPYNVGASATYDAARNDLVTWARHVSENSGRDLPWAQPCHHATCWATGERWILGPACPHPDAVVALWLGAHRQVNWLRHRPEAKEAFVDLTRASRNLVRMVDRPPQRVIVGQCGCGAYLYAINGASDVTCRDCGTTYDVETSRDLLRRDLDERLLTAAEIALMATYLGLAEKRDATRKLINTWSRRGLIVAHADVAGEPAFRFGEIVRRLATSKRAA